MLIRTFNTFAKVAKILLMLLLIGFECVQAFSWSNVHYINEASQQCTRSQILVNAAYTLVYRPVDEQAQAMHDLQTVLPAFEQEQNLLLTNPAANIQYFLLQARSDYLSLATTAQIIIDHPNNTFDPLELNILITHEHNYLSTMTALVLTLPLDIESSNIQLFVIQIVIEVVFLILFFMVIATLGRKKQTHKETRLVQTPFFVRKIAMCALILVLMGLEAIPPGIRGDMEYFDQATLQRTRCEVFAKSAMVLAYRPATENLQALNDIQVSLPLFQKEQAILLTNKNVHVLKQAQKAAVEHQIMSTATQALATQSGEVADMAVVNTVVSHAHGCVEATNTIVNVLQGQSEQQATFIFLAEVAIEGALIIFFATLLLLSCDPFVPPGEEPGGEKAYAA